MSKFFTYDFGSLRVGINHVQGSIRSLVQQAIMLGRVPLIPLPPLSPHHNFGKAITPVFSKYFNLDEIEIQIKGSRFLYSSVESVPLNLSTFTVGRNDKISKEQNEKFDIIIRSKIGDGLLWDYHPDMPNVIFKSSDFVLDYYDSVKMDRKYYAMHVRRGDKLKEARYPNLDKDTKPERILETLRKHVPLDSILYIMTNEKDKHYFDLIRRHYTVVQYSDFKILRGLIESPLPDNFLLYEIEKHIFARAEKQIYTFSRFDGVPQICLTSDKGKE